MTKRMHTQTENSHKDEDDLETKKYVEINIKKDTREHKKAKMIHKETSKDMKDKQT